MIKANWCDLPETRGTVKKKKETGKKIWRKMAGAYTHL